MNLTGCSVLFVWIISIAVHAVLFSAMLGLVFPFSIADNEPDLSVTHAEIIGSVDGTPLPPLRLPEPARRAEVFDQQPRWFTPEEFVPLSELIRFKKPQTSIIGIGAGGGNPGARGLGLTVGDEAGPEFFGLGGSARGARKIVYVVDRSGSMIDTFIYVQAELKRSISALRRSQKFHVIFFNSGLPLENPPKRLVSAIAAQRSKFLEFMGQVFPVGGTKPEAAMRRALTLEPDLIYLLSDGIDFHPGLLQKLDEWNQGRRTRIYTIAYLDRTGSNLLEQIAREHHGEFRFVSEHDLP